MSESESTFWESSRSPMGGMKSPFRAAGEFLDALVWVVSPKVAYKRKAYRFSFDAIDSHRTRTKRTSGVGGTGDSRATEQTLFQLREICRDLCRNNPLIDGMFVTERDGTIGSGPKIQARTGDEGLNEELEAAWKEEMIDQACDVTGCYSFGQLLGMMYESYRRDGDSAAIFLDDKIQAVEGENIGTPWGMKNPILAPQHFEIINGVAYSRQTKARIGFYIGESDRQYGYIKANSWKKYTADQVHLMFNPRRFSQSRGLPVLTSAIDFVDKVTGYVDAELVAAKVNACFSMFVSTEMMPDPYTQGGSATGRDPDGNQLEKMEPGSVLYGKPGESATGIGQTRPGSLFDPFVKRMLTFIGRPMCMPLMLITLDFAGATFMNARIAYQKVHEAWEREQDWVVKPFASRAWRWKMQRLIETKRIKTSNPNVLAHDVVCRTWPYVDPYKEAMAHKQELENRTNNRTLICARQGLDFREIQAARMNEDELIGDDGGGDKSPDDVA